MDNADLGKLINDHLNAHEQVVNLRAELEQTGEHLILLGDNLKKHPENIRSGEAKIILKDKQYDDRTILWRRLNIADIFQTLEQYKESAALEKQLARMLSEAGKGYIVEGLANRKPQCQTSESRPGEPARVKCMIHRPTARRTDPRAHCTPTGLSQTRRAHPFGGLGIGWWRLH